MEFIKTILFKIKIYLSEDEANKEIKRAKILASNKFILSLSLIIFILGGLFINIMLYTIEFAFNRIKNKKLVFNFLKGIFSFSSEFWFIYLIVFIILLLIIVKLQFRLKTSFRSINEGQKGTSKFCTIKEVDEQYKSIPEVETDEETKKGGYEGKGGVVISRLGKKVYIDDSKSNNLVIGTTRSGKGELFLFPTIDAYSRAKEKASLVINDPKGELLGGSKETLEKRGYRIEVLNLINPEKSMSYNPLQLIINAYEKGDLGEAQKLCKTLTYAMYYKPNVKDPFWNESAMSLVNALILAVIDKVFKEINPLKDELNKREDFIKENTDEALLKKNKERIEEVKKELKEKEKNKEKITLYTVAQMLSTLGSVYDEKGNNELDKYFQSLDVNNIAKIQYATSNFAKGTARGSIFSVAMSELQKFTMEKIAKLTSKNSIDLLDVGFYNEKDNRPVAIFIILPDYDKSDYIISSMFIRQLYYVSAKNAEECSGECDRDIVYLIDEAGNVPPIEDLETLLTVGLGRRIFFTLVVQELSQIEAKYGKDASKTIISSCANKIYIITTDKDTAREISELLGDKTITTVSRSGEFMDTTKHHTESVDSQKLIDANKLMLFKEGETVVIRTLKRRNKKGDLIVPNPIHNYGETRMKYRYEYLGKYFDNTKRVKDIDIKCIHNDVKLEDLILFNLDNQVLYSDVDVKTPGEYLVKVKDKESKDGIKEYKVIVKDIEEVLKEKKDNKKENLKNNNTTNKIKIFEIREIFSPKEYKKIIIELKKSYSSKQYEKITYKSDFKELENIYNIKPRENLKNWLDIGIERIKEM
ncbi:type IV secretory system conjugative DNA transfer family protein [Eubacterium multiforme]|uniref:Type IV secretion system protein VirD4 n=1 Tax=Eubacterium multiforme TaxID=83339 RepID=A0ABT9UTI8_9FIRM|nr:type IV secretory system conjugative DNA transfer family protein [Eubacterium multiforme]MDQ0149622.1 type IV secretion system protein VirD4 [Eubacterium multiforme]